MPDYNGEEYKTDFAMYCTKRRMHMFTDPME